MHYVYMIRSVDFSNKTYIGCTKDLQKRLDCHNSGRSLHAKLYKPWKLVVAILFDEKQKAIEFEGYLKSGSGRAFAQRRLW